MSKLYEFLGFIFFFYSEEHIPIHVHVKKGGNESKCELHYDEGTLVLKWRKIRNRVPLTPKEIKKAEPFIRKYHLGIVSKWNQVFIFGKKVQCEKISQL